MRRRVAMIGAVCAIGVGTASAQTGGVRLVYKLAAAADRPAELGTARDVVNARLARMKCAPDCVALVRLDRLVVELAGTAERLSDIKQALTHTSKLELAMVDDEAMKLVRTHVLADPDARSHGVDLDAALDPDTIRHYVEDHAIAVPPERKLVFEHLEPTHTWQAHLVDRTPRLTGASISDAHIEFDHTNALPGDSMWPSVKLTLDPAAAVILGDLTAANVGKKLAILVDDKVQSAPVIKGAIYGGSLVITMGAPDPVAARAQADDLVMALRTGALPALVLESEVVVGDAFENRSDNDLRTRILLIVVLGVVLGLVGVVVVRARRSQR